MELSKKYNITMVGFHKGSTFIKFDGSPTAVCNARQEVEKLLSDFVMQEVPFQHPTVLVDSLKKRFQEEDIHVYLDQLPDATSSLHMCSFSRVHLNRALRILEDKPFEGCIQIYPGTDLTKLTDACNTGVSKKGYSVVLLMPTKHSRGTEGELVVYGFLKQEVQSAQQLLETLVDHFTVKITPLQCTPEQMAYVKQFLLENPNQEAQLFLEAITLHVQVTSQENTIFLSGTSKAIQRASTQIESHLQNVSYDTIPFNCHSDFLTQIQHYIIKPMEREGSLNVLFTYNKSPPSSAESSVTTFSISVFSRKVEDFAQASNRLKVNMHTQKIYIEYEYNIYILEPKFSF